MNMPREWTRGVQWLAGRREAWEPRMRAAQAAWSEIEMVSVSEGLRSSALVHLEPAELPRASADCARVGLGLTVLAHAEDGSFRAAIHVPGLAAEWSRAWAESDHEAVGKMLGFPGCCREFFARAWAATSDRDITPAMDTVEGPWQANTMLRWLGVRLVPHLPCSADCGETIANAEAYLRMADRIGIDVGDLETLLRLPVTHDAMNGVLIVSTPHFRFMAGANRERFVASRLEDATPREPLTWADNGFNSWDAMEAAHAAVLEAVPAGTRSAIDLGSGDGRLLWRLSARGGHGPWHGIEVDADRVERGKRRHGTRVGMSRGLIQDTKFGWETYDVALLMPGRLLEMDPAAAGKIRDALPRLARRLVLVAYGDWLTDHGGLGALAEKAGLGLVGPITSAYGAAAAEGVLR